MTLRKKNGNHNNDEDSDSPVRKRGGWRGGRGRGGRGRGGRGRGVGRPPAVAHSSAVLAERRKIRLAEV